MGICDCCYGSALQHSFCNLHERGKGQTVFNSAFGLILYDKWIKDTPVYHERAQVFEKLSVAMKGIDSDLVILDIGVGTGAFTEALADAFMHNQSDTLAVTDISPQALHYVRTRVVEKNEQLRNKRIEYFNNDPNTLALDTGNYGDNEIDIAFMSFTLNHISAGNGDRHCILKEIYNYCKPNGYFIVMEFGSDIMQKYGDH